MAGTLTTTLAPVDNMVTACQIQSMVKNQQVRLGLVPVDEQPDGTMRRMDVWFEVPLGGSWATAPWRVAYRLRPSNDEIIVTELRVFPHLGSPGLESGIWNVEGGVVPKEGLTARLIRDEVVLGKHVHQMLPEFWHSITGKTLVRQGYELAGRQFAQMFDGMLGRLGFTAQPRHRVPRRGPKGLSDHELARIAAAYVGACERAERAPVKVVSKELRKAPTAIRDALHKAREVGVLTRTEAGRAGGLLSPYGESLLREEPGKKEKRGKR